MGSAKILSLFMCYHFLHSFVHGVTHSIYPNQSLCHENEVTALLQFKQSFSINWTACHSPHSNSRWMSWEKGTHCCSWDGVECDKTSSHVIGLDLGNSCLYGSLNSSSSLFKLVHLQRLNLADNNFNYSRVPAALGCLSRLTHLNLTSSYFYGQIHPQVLGLSKLVSLDLRSNPFLKIQTPSLENLVQNLTSLRELGLSNTNISSTVPDTLANLSSLAYLYLKDCFLYGEFPSRIFNLPKLRIISLRFNPKLNGVLPEFDTGSPLEELRLEGTNFSGNIPSSIGYLSSLNWLNFRGCKFLGPIPASLGNLKHLTYLSLSDNNFSSSIPPSLANLTKLNYLSLSDNGFSGSVPMSLERLNQLAHLSLSNNNFDNWTLPSWVGKLSELNELYLGGTSLTGKLPSSLSNLTRLDRLVLHSNNLTSQIPSWIANLTQLTFLDISANHMQGPVPSSIFQMVNLHNLDLSRNQLTNTVDFGKFTRLKNLQYLDLSANELSVLTDTITNGTFPMFKLLGLGSCNLSKFPDFLRSQQELEWLDLSRNKIHGLIPRWFSSTSVATMLAIFLRCNLLTGFEEQLTLPWRHISVLILSENKLQGSLPMPAPSINVYIVSKNSLTGNAPLVLCNLTSLYVLDLSHNNLSGLLPPCLGNFSDNLLILNIQRNNFHGAVPQPFRNGSQLRSIIFSQNQLQGQLPVSLTNCEMLESLDVSDNQITGTFPSWLGTLQTLKILSLRSNNFHGIVRSLGPPSEFPKLQILDLSHNGFTGNLPREFFSSLNAMKLPNENGSNYIQPNFNLQLHGHFVHRRYKISYAVKVSNKGIETSYKKVMNKLMVMDLSSNRFQGAIPDSVGILKGLTVLNLSNNCFAGLIPSSLGNLKKLESLDLSQNKLFGRIPEQLSGLDFLAFVNFSYNNLSGLIPYGIHFNTLQANSFLGNPRLCGSSLHRHCGTLHPPITPEQGQQSESKSEFDWVFVLTGYTSGMVVGLVMGCEWTKKNDWFLRIQRR